MPIHVLRKIDYCIQHDIDDYQNGTIINVAVLTGYSAQLRELKRAIAPQEENCKSIKIECNTIDAFQGREADIAIYSVTRSNREGKIGFLRDLRRLNVALSRGRERLVIVGDYHFCRRLNEKVSEVLQYIERHSEDCIITPYRI